MDEPWLVGDQGTAPVKADSSHPISEPSKGSCTVAVSSQGFQTAGLCFHVRNGEHLLGTDSLPCETGCRPREGLTQGLVSI